MEYVLGTAAIVHIAGLMHVLGYLSRDQLILRGFLLAGTAVYIVFYAVQATGPMWSAMLWSTVLGAANLYVIVSMILDRRVQRFTEDEQKLFSEFAGMSPGQFRRLMRAGKWMTAASPTVLTTENERPWALYYVLEGGITIAKSGREFQVQPPMFIGEVAWLLNTDASATVEIADGARYVVWDTGDLKALLKRNPDLGLCLDNLLNRDLAGKIARS